MMEKFKIECLDIDSISYPILLREIKKPPKKLFFIGNIELLSNEMVSVVGSRKCSQYGIWAAENVGKILSGEGISVVSGMANGIDSAAHRGALCGPGSTIAVLGCGIDVCFPAGNRKLRNEIAEKGLILSEYPPGMPGTKWTFPERNRIISGISCATVIAEAGLNSGALITAEFANEQNKTVFAVPGNINCIYSLGVNKLIQEGAYPIATFEDIFDVLGLQREKSNTVYDELGTDEQKILKVILENGETTVDYLAEILNKKISDVNAIVAVMEIKGILYTSLGKIFVANIRK